MNDASKVWIALFSFIAGCIITYFSVQYEFLSIEYDINVIDGLLSLTTIFVGAYIGTTINSSFNRKSYLINFLEPKLETCWKKSNDFRSIIEANTSIDHYTFSKSIHDIEVDLAHLESIFKTFKKSKQCIIDWQTVTEKLEKKIADLPLVDNVYDITTIKPELLSFLTECDNKYVESVNYIHKQ